MQNCFQLASGLLALPAAGLWFWSAMTHIPDFLDMTLSGETSPSAYMKKQSQRSAWGAAFAGAAALCQFIATIS